MNIERIDAAIALMEMVHENNYKFDIGYWVGDPYAHYVDYVDAPKDIQGLIECGSVAGFGGWLACSKEWRDAGGFNGDRGRPCITTDEGRGLRSEDAIAYYFDIDNQIAEALVYPHARATWRKVLYPYANGEPGITALDVANALRTIRDVIFDNIK